jgi:hypothetical protein
VKKNIFYKILIFKNRDEYMIKVSVLSPKAKGMGGCQYISELVKSA